MGSITGSIIETATEKPFTFAYVIIKNLQDTTIVHGKLLKKVELKEEKEEK